MRKVKEVIVVEGKYDKNALSQVVDAVIIETSGFGIFNNVQKQKLLKLMAEKSGLIILTDPDGAGLVIRNFLKGIVDPALIKQAYVPQIDGREKRKRSPSKEGKLGVEGMRPQVLLDALIRCGAVIDGEGGRASAGISKADMYAAGLYGRSESAMRREKLIEQLDLPKNISSGALLDVLNAVMTRDEFLSLHILDTN